MNRFAKVFLLMLLVLPASTSAQSFAPTLLLRDGRSFRADTIEAPELFAAVQRKSPYASAIVTTASDPATCIAGDAWVNTALGKLKFCTATNTIVVVATGTVVTSVTAASPLSSSGGATPNITIQNAAADGSTKGAASFTANDFDATSGNIAIDYTNGQTASGAAKGFLSAADWTTFNNKESTANKDATGGYAGLTLFKINFKNAANTFTSFFTNSNSAARTYTFQNRDGTIVDDTDLALKAPLASPTFTGAPAAPTASVDTNTTQIATTAYVVGQGYAKLASPSFTTPALGVASATSINFGGTALATYVEGSCTLSLKFNGLSVGLTYSIQTCKYTQIGDLVSVDATLVLSAKGSSTGQVTITGLPVAATSTANRYQVVMISGSSMSYTGTIKALIDPSATTSISVLIDNGGAQSNMADTNFTNTSVIIVNAVYKTN